MIVPPIKCQGIKTKLVDWIKAKMPNEYNVWQEPFMGSGVVGFNVQPKKAVFYDTNPHIIQFYNDIKRKFVTSDNVKAFLSEESVKLQKYADEYYKEVRNRFNANPNSFDFLFLNRCCFNGMMRFNRQGDFNVPFCKKNDRLSKAYISKISNQVKNIEILLSLYDYKFIVQSFYYTIDTVSEDDIIYCDPPYIDRYSDYFNVWQQQDEEALYNYLLKTKSKFILSTWHHNKYRNNLYIEKYWNKFNIDTKEHFYYLGAKEDNRNSMTEALVTNF